MLRYFIILFVSISLSACADRTVSEVVPSAATIGTPETIFVSTSRAREANGYYGFRRGETIKFLDTTVSIPPNHTPGTLKFSYANPNPQKEFVLANVTELSGPSGLREHLRGEDDVTIFVHGYNSTQTETIFRAAQLTHDIGLPGSTLVYSWPSRATGYGYAYDLDSMLFARDGLEQTIRELKSLGVKRVTLVAHSMGGALSMEMMRQAELQEPGWANRNIEGVVLISPDLDLDLFRSQMKRIDNPPDPFIVMVSQKDKILNISGRLRGTDEGQRLGNISSVASLEEFPISIVDTTAFNRDAQSSHFVAATSPALLSIISSLRLVNNTFGREDRPVIDILVPPSERNADGATEIVLTETGQAQVTTP
ncbi:alpha/beta hydrolase [Ruegeria arenilitoris]|uniref:alpha/beta hydrolase n=1 Tax=Ruegeria arenilitoris TaxID=1173585 RepID=UPI00147B883D